MNKLIIIGNLTRDPETRVTPGGIRVCNFTVAVTRRGRDGDSTDFVRVTAWRERAESCAQYLHKGSRVCCWGPVEVHMYQTQTGETRASMQMTADEIEFCGGSRRAAGDGQADDAPPEQVQMGSADGMQPVEDDDCPF